MRKSRLIQQFDSGEELVQARLVEIAHRSFAIWADPFRMLRAQVVVNLLLQLGHGVDRVTDHELSGRNCPRSKHKLWTNEITDLFIRIVEK
jgi:hypothetical protein